MPNINAKMRRLARKYGYKLYKGRGIEKGWFAIVDVSTNAKVFSTGSGLFCDRTIEEVAEFFAVE